MIFLLSCTDILVDDLFGLTCDFVQSRSLYCYLFHCFLGQCRGRFALAMLSSFFFSAKHHTPFIYPDHCWCALVPRSAFAEMINELKSFYWLRCNLLSLDLQQVMLSAKSHSKITEQIHTDTRSQPHKF